MELYLDAFHLHVQQLRSSGATVSNEIEASVLLKGLDNGYESFIVTTTQSFRQNVNSDSKIDVEQLVSQLRDEDRRRAAGRTPTEIGSASTGSALYSNRTARENERDRKRHRHHTQDHPHPTCNYCNREGHRQDVCWVLHPEKKPERFEKRAKLVQASMAIADARLAAAGILAGDRDLF
jgi:hypothetical protein